MSPFQICDFSLFLILVSFTLSLLTYVSFEGLHLLGFKSKSFMKSYYYVKPGLFLYPDETVSFIHKFLRIFCEF